MKMNKKKENIVTNKTNQASTDELKLLYPRTNHHVREYGIKCLCL